MTSDKKNPDPAAETRKQDHIELALKSRVASCELDERFYYEPLLAAHPETGSLPPVNFLKKTLRAPIWVSSMTGGTPQAGAINRNLARACGEFGLGMGLGSCRQLLYDNTHFADFDVRDIMGIEAPLFVNLGVAQVEKLLERKEPERIPELIRRLRADGLIVHVNPLQEAMQPEGDIFRRPALETLQELLQLIDNQVIVKEVGQGFGPGSLRALLQLPLAAIEFAAAGGTNFARLELLRSDEEKRLIFDNISRVGHSSAEMLEWANRICRDLGQDCRAQHLIISGGVNDFLDGYYLTQKSLLPAVYGQASAFLKYAREDYKTLQQFVQAQIRGLELARAFLSVKEA